MKSETREVLGVTIPAFLYGTAWKEDRTEPLVRQALAAGFRAIDTANQRKHYVEAGVGAALAATSLPREALFLQTKFTYARGQDERLPYDPKADLSTQVAQSFASSLEHLGTDHLDALLLHGPWGASGWDRHDREVWRALEARHVAGSVRLIGVSNVSLEQLEACWQDAAVRPAFVQNRCYARTGWDRDVRAFCDAHGIVYQGFSLLTANRKELALPAVTAIAARLGATVPEVVFSFARALGLLPITGTSDPAHMELDLASGRLALTPAERATLESIGG